MNNFPNSKNNTNILSPIKLKEAFKMFSIDQKYLSIHSFNKALEYLFKPPIPIIANTYLSQKLFNIIDPYKTGQIDENNFCQTFINILTDRNYRISLSMQAMMTIPDNNRNYIEIDELKKFIFNSYIEGFKNLGNLINLNRGELQKNNLPVANLNQLMNWAKNCETKIYQEIDNDLKSIDNRIIDKIEYNNFLKWINVDHCLYLQYGFIYLPVSTSLIVLDKVKFDDSELRKMMPAKVVNNNNNNNINNNSNNNSNNINNNNNSNNNNNNKNVNNNNMNDNKLNFCNSFVILNEKDLNESIKKNNDFDAFGFEIMTKDDFK